jgi:hypothetical protein
MKLIHHDIEIEISDEWWAEAGMEGFVRKCGAYYVDQGMYPKVREVSIEDVGPVYRAHNVPILTRERVICVLRGFRAGASIPPVQIVVARSTPHMYKLTDGTHRLYCSLAAGFSNIPAVDGFDWNATDR